MKNLFVLINIITTTEIVWGATLGAQSARAGLGAQPGTVGVLQQSARGLVGDGTGISRRVGGDVGSVVGSAANAGGQVAGQGAGIGVGISGGVSKTAGSTTGGGGGNVAGSAVNGGSQVAGGTGRGQGTGLGVEISGGVSKGAGFANSGGALNPSISVTQSALTNGRGGVDQRGSDGGLGTRYGSGGRGAGNSIGQGIGDGMGGGTSCWETERTASRGGLNKNDGVVGTSGDVLQNTHGGSFLGMVGEGGILRAVKAPPKRKAQPNAKPAVAPAKRPRAVCPTSGFSYSALLGSNGCICNFAGACDMKTNKPTAAALKDPKTLSGFAPTNVESVALEGPSVGTICESDTVAILYDCFARIPLYSATVIKGSNAGGM